MIYVIFHIIFYYDILLLFLSSNTTGIGQKIVPLSLVYRRRTSTHLHLPAKTATVVESSRLWISLDFFTSGRRQIYRRDSQRLAGTFYC